MTRRSRTWRTRACRRPECQADTQWIAAGTYTTQPLHGVASIALPAAFDTVGVLLQATGLTTDPYGNYYLQLMDLEVRP